MCVSSLISIGINQNCLDVFFRIPVSSDALKISEKFHDQKGLRGDFPGGPVVKNPPSNAGDVGSIPGQGTKIPHAAGQLNLHATTTELARLNERAHVPANYRAQALWSPHTTATEPTCPGARMPQLERRLCTAMKDPACLNKDPACHNQNLMQPKK